MRLFLLVLCTVCAMGCSSETRTEILFKTTKGDIKVVLYDEQTPEHAANFRKLAEEGYFNGTLFHRVIKDFMIQGGDPDSRTAEKGQMLGDGGPGYDLESEFRIPDIIHRRGVLAAAREVDEVTNPDMRSSASQFYIVWGKVFDDHGLDSVQVKVDQRTKGTVKLTPEMREIYKTVGGTPHLDGSFTIFGEVTLGLDVVNVIQNVATDANDRPLEDIRITSTEVLR